MLQVDEPKKQLYSPKICRFLVSKRVVSQSMVKGGLIKALADVDDWVSAITFGSQDTKSDFVHLGNSA